MACQNTTAHSPVAKNCKGPVMHGLGRRDWEAYFINCVCWAELFKVFFHLFSQSWAGIEKNGITPWIFGGYLLLKTACASLITDYLILSTYGGYSSLFSSLVGAAALFALNFINHRDREKRPYWRAPSMKSYQRPPSFKKEETQKLQINSFRDPMESLEISFSVLSSFIM